MPHDEVPAHLNAMDVLAAPSQTTPRWVEQLGRMLIEAFACGVPVVASDSGEIPHVVADAGLIVGEADESGLGRGHRRPAGEPEPRGSLRRRGLERARSVYAWPVVARRHLEFFEERLEDAGPDAGSSTIKAFGSGSTESSSFARASRLARPGPGGDVGEHERVGPGREVVPVGEEGKLAPR